MNEAGLALEQSPGDLQQLREVRRAVHTLKGDSAACGYRQLSELAHGLEDVLTPEIAQQHTGRVAEVILTAADTFHEMLAAYRNNLQPPTGGALREHIDRLLTKPAAEPEKAPVEARFEWSEYERLMIAEAIRRGEDSGVAARTWFDGSGHPSDRSRAFHQEDGGLDSQAMPRANGRRAHFCR